VDNQDIEGSAFSGRDDRPMSHSLFVAFSYFLLHQLDKKIPANRRHATGHPGKVKKDDNDRHKIMSSHKN